jgi:hexosaminidase
MKRSLFCGEALRAIFSANVVRKTQWRIPCVKIKDYPRFGWRGLMLDTGHDFQHLSYIFRFIDLMAPTEQAGPKQ